MKQTPLGSIASILETQASKIIKEYVDRSIQATLQQAAEQLSHPSNRKIMHHTGCMFWIQYWIQISKCCKNN